MGMGSRKGLEGMNKGWRLDRGREGGSSRGIMADKGEESGRRGEGGGLARFSSLDVTFLVMFLHL